MPVSPELLRRLRLYGEENTARSILESHALARLYPTGEVPPWGVTMCREWLRSRLDEDSFGFRLLNLVEIDADDQDWALNGVPQGGVAHLVAFIVGDLSKEGRDELYTDMAVDYQALASGVRHAVKRKNRLKKSVGAPPE